MKALEAIARIKEHIVIHRAKEPFAIYITEALKSAISALEFRVPEKPVPKGLTNKICCPSCNNDKFDKKHRCCPNCGQRLDWSDYT